MAEPLEVTYGSSPLMIDWWEIFKWLLETFYAGIIERIVGAQAAIIAAMPEFPEIRFPSLEEIEEWLRKLVQAIPDIATALPLEFILQFFGPLAFFIRIFGIGWYLDTYLPAKLSARVTGWRQGMVEDFSVNFLGPDYQYQGLRPLLSDSITETFTSTVQDIGFRVHEFLFHLCWALGRPVGWHYPSGTLLAEATLGVGDAAYQWARLLGGSLQVWLIENVIGEEYRGKPMATVFTASALQIVDDVITTLTPTAHLLWAWALEQGGNILVGARPFIDHRVRPALAWARDALASGGEAMLRSMEYALPRGRAITPDDAYTIGGSLYSMAFVFGTGAHFTAALLDAIPFVDALGLQQLAGFVSQMGSFEEISRATYGVLISQALAWPMRYYVNREYRPMIPPTGEIYTMGRKRGITRGEFGTFMAYQGLSEWWIDRIYEFFWTDPSLYWLMRMADVEVPPAVPAPEIIPWLDRWIPDWRTNPKWWLYRKMMLAGYDDTDMEVFTNVIRRRPLGPALTQVKTSVRALMRDGWWWRGEPEEVLRPLGIRQDEIELMRAAEQLDYQHKVLEEWVDIYTQERRKGTIDTDQHRLALASLGMHTLRAEQEILMETIRLLPTPTEPKAPKPDPEVAKILADYTKAYIELYRERAIDLWQLYTYLLALGYTKARAKSTCALEGARRLRLPKLEDPYFLADLWREVMEMGGQRLHDHFRARRITEAQYLAFLIAYGWPVDIARYIVDLDILQLFVESVPVE